MTSHNLSFVLAGIETEIKPVVPFQPGIDRLTGLDLTATNADLSDELLGDLDAFCHYINNHLSRNQARYAIGGYAEHRTIYRVSEVFDPVGGGEEPRRLHLGTDIWGPAGTAVMNPLPATVHSTGFHEQAGDYGAVIILEHNLKEFSFYTLYGHLNLAAIQTCRPGLELAAGTSFAQFGIPEENGYWPPHLHFQLILNLGEYTGDYPGVCRYSEKDTWLDNSPDPDILLRLNQYMQ